MRKITVCMVCFLCVSMVSTTVLSVPIALNQNTSTSCSIQPTLGTYNGSIGLRRPNNATELGTISGTYMMRQRGGHFLGEWTLRNDTQSGIMKGIFTKHFLIGKISALINGTNRTLPIIGFLKFSNNEFVGRFMAPVGPALYFWGTYT